MCLAYGNRAVRQKGQRNQTQPLPVALCLTFHSSKNVLCSTSSLWEVFPSKSWPPVSQEVNTSWWINWIRRIGSQTGMRMERHLLGGHENHSSYTQAGFHHQSARLHNLMLSLQPNVDSLSAGLITTKETGLTYHECQNHLLNPALSPLRLATASVTFHLPVFTFLDLDNNRKFMLSCWAFPIYRVSSLL